MRLEPETSAKTEGKSRAMVVGSQGSGRTESNGFWTSPWGAKPEASVGSHPKRQDSETGRRVTFPEQMNVWQARILAHPGVELGVKFVEQTMNEDAPRPVIQPAKVQQVGVVEPSRLESPALLNSERGWPAFSRAPPPSSSFLRTLCWQFWPTPLPPSLWLPYHRFLIRSCPFVP